MRSSDLALVSATRAALASGKARTDRIAASVSMSEMAATLGVSRQAVSGWENGRITPTAEHALAYGRLLGQLTRKAA